MFAQKILNVTGNFHIYLFSVLLNLSCMCQLVLGLHELILQKVSSVIFLFILFNFINQCNGREQEYGKFLFIKKMKFSLLKNNHKQRRTKKLLISFFKVCNCKIVSVRIVN